MIFRKQILIFSFFLIFCHFSTITGQPADTTSFKLFTRLSFYSHEKNGEFLLHIPPDLQYTQLSIKIKSDKDSITSWKGSPGKSILRIPFTINMKPSVKNVTASVTAIWRSGAKYSANTLLTILPYKPNEVKTDRLTGGLIVNKKPFFPFGFYCYSPVSPTLPEEEIVKGFNMISPYQNIVPGTINERKVYMDRCAEIGMKVHYNLLSVSASTGPKADTIPEDEKNRRLIAEVKAFMNHPALLAWYISDEPNGFKIPPEVLEKIYNTVREYDPWHPVSMVFMAPFMASRKYSAAFDIVMADPYPVPTMSVKMVSDLGKQLKDEFYGKQPQWMVIQQFGGGEWWEREPTLQETRSMTWQSIINGATGIQYFIRWGPNFFPKSTASWSECGRMALEVAEISPWLLSDEEANNVSVSSPDIDVTSKLHNGKLAVIAVNKKNEPVTLNVYISGISGGRAHVLFENRSITLQGSTINDQMGPFASQTYMIDLKKDSENNKPDNRNLLKDPGFENTSSPGVPAACYARSGTDKGATYFTDTKEKYKGNHSLRLYTPREDQGVALRFFPCKVAAGKTYIISLRARSDPEQRFNSDADPLTTQINGASKNPQYVEVSFGEFHSARFAPDEKWRQFVTFVTIPSDTTETVRTNLILSMPGQGVAWFDELRVVEE